MENSVLTVVMTVQLVHFASVQTEEGCEKADRHGLSAEMRQLSAIGVIKVAVRSLSMDTCSSKP